MPCFRCAELLLFHGEGLGAERKTHMMSRVIVVGSLNMDLVARAPRIPRPGETIIGEVEALLAC
jgi:hypothetical protein